MTVIQNVSSIQNVLNHKHVSTTNVRTHVKEPAVYVLIAELLIIVPFVAVPKDTEAILSLNAGPYQVSLFNGTYFFKTIWIQMVFN